MKHLKWMLLIIFVLFIIIAAVQNEETLLMPVTFKINLILSSLETPLIPMSLVVIIVFLVGMLSSGLYGIIERVRLMAQIKTMKKEAKEKDKELNSLRNLPVTVDDIDTEITAANNI